jgi:hypothetical protein
MRNIVNFNEKADYLPILNGAIMTDLIFMLCLMFGVFHSNMLRKWYQEYSLSGVICDVLILVIGIILARFLYPKLFSSYSLLKFILLAVGIQCTHDILFYFLFTAIPKGKSRIFDTFKAYGKESGGGAILADSLMMISTILIATYLKGLTINVNIITLIVSVYLVPYMIYSL